MTKIRLTTTVAYQSQSNNYCPYFDRTIQRINRKNKTMPIMKCESLVNEAKKKAIKPELAVSSQLIPLWQRITVTTFRLKTMVTYY